jgi:hypothetical protein
LWVWVGGRVGERERGREGMTANTYDLLLA